MLVSVGQTAGTPEPLKGGSRKPAEEALCGGEGEQGR